MFLPDYLPSDRVFLICEARREIREPTQQNLCHSYTKCKLSKSRVSFLPNTQYYLHPKLLPQMFDHGLEPDDASSSRTQCYEEAFTEYDKRRSMFYPALLFILQKGLKTFWYIYVMMTTTLALHFVFCTYQDSRSGAVGILDHQKPLLRVAEDSTGFIPQCMWVYLLVWTHDSFLN